MSNDEHEGLSPANAALLARMEKKLALSPGLREELARRWSQTNLLLDAARAEAAPGLNARDIIQSDALLRHMRNQEAFATGVERFLRIWEPASEDGRESEDFARDLYLLLQRAQEIGAAGPMAYMTKIMESAATLAPTILAPPGKG